MTPLHWAAYWGHVEVVSTFLDRGALIGAVAKVIMIIRILIIYLYLHLVR